MALLASVIQRGVRASQPAATAVGAGTLYCVTDEGNAVERSNGTTWDAFSPAASTGARGGTVWMGGGDGGGDDGGISIPGPPGAAGAAGATGAAGAAGAMGATGPSGPAGWPGTDGEDAECFAIPGPVGATGATGPTGATGQAGQNGTIGMPGEPGDDGQQWMIPGRPGVDGASGVGTAGGVSLPIGGSGVAITTGVKFDLEMPCDGVWTAARLFADQAGSIVIDLWKDTYANFPPTVADTITASAKPTLSAAAKSQDVTLTGWTTSFSAGDVVRVNVDSATTVTQVTLALRYTRT